MVVRSVCRECRLLGPIIMLVGVTGEKCPVPQPARGDGVTISKSSLCDL